MKKNNETWLAFFKKSLKVFGTLTITLIVIAIIIIGIVIYRAANYDKTYLDCENRYVAFADYYVRMVSAGHWIDYSTWGF